MKESKEFMQWKDSSQRNDLEETWVQVITLLKAAEDAGKWAFWRERFGCTHPDHNTEEIDNPARFACANFFAAKHVYCVHKEAMDKLADDIDQGNVISYPYKTEHLQLFYAMKRVVEEEMAAQLEEQILNNEEPTGYWEGDEYLPMPESNDIEFDLNSY